jgi:hypothetical protein
MNKQELSRKVLREIDDADLARGSLGAVFPARKNPSN